jgi:hypothetical protein
VIGLADRGNEIDWEMTPPAYTSPVESFCPLKGFVLISYQTEIVLIDHLWLNMLNT